jgi:hypothetical protein
MDPVLNTTIGVVAGGVVTYATQRGLDGRREQRQRERETRAEQLATDDSELNTRMAARLVFMDLLAVFTLLRSSRDVNRWWIQLGLPTDAWKQHRETLCRALGDHPFRLVGSTFTGVEAWNAVCIASRRYYWVRPHLPLKEGAHGLTDMRDTLIESAARALLALSDVGLGTLETDDPLIEMIRAETQDDDQPSTGAQAKGFAGPGSRPGEVRPEGAEGP